MKLKQIGTFKQNVVHQIVLETLNYPNTTGNESNIILKTYGLPVIGGRRNESYNETFKV